MAQHYLLDLYMVSALSVDTRINEGKNACVLQRIIISA